MSGYQQQDGQTKMRELRPRTMTGLADYALNKLQACCKKRGVNGIKSFGRMFRLYDQDGSKSLTLDEWRLGLREYGADLNQTEADVLFQSFDRDGSGTIIFDELLENIRPPMSKDRIALVEQAFDKLDKTKDGVITIQDLQAVYNPKFHPKFKSGELTEKMVFQEFLKTFDDRDESKRDGKVTKEEFFNYYAGVSASIDRDVYFDFMMRNAWDLS